jgi:hypothetical protein
MPLTALLRLAGDSVSSLVVVGDTPADVECGLRAGAGLVVGVLSGDSARAELEAVPAVAGLPGAPLIWNRSPTSSRTSAKAACPVTQIAGQRLAARLDQRRPSRGIDIPPVHPVRAGRDEVRDGRRPVLGVHRGEPGPRLTARPRGISTTGTFFVAGKLLTPSEENKF